MDVMDMRRRLMMMQINGRIPSNMAADEITVETSTTKTIAHSLGQIPDAIVIFPKSAPTGTGPIYPYMIYGTLLGGGGYRDCPNKLVSSYSNSSGNWDYVGSNQGWKADAQYVYLSFAIEDRMRQGEYVLITYKYFN